METLLEVNPPSQTSQQPPPEVDIQRFWTRRLTGGGVEDLLPSSTDLLLQDGLYFPSARVEEEEVVESESSAKKCALSPYQCDHLFPQEIEEKACRQETSKRECYCEEKFVELSGKELGDIPAVYKIPAVRAHEFPAVGIYIDSRIIPGFRYRVRPIQENGRKEGWLFNGKALQLDSIGRGYSKRVTFAPTKGNINNNPHYFWTDSRPFGYAFELEVISPGDKFTVFDANHVAVGTLEIVQNQMSQEEIGHRVLKDKEVEKMVRVRSICKVEWFEDQDADLIVPMSGVVSCVKGKVRRIIGVTVGSHPRRGFTLTPGINSRLRSIFVRGNSISDIPTEYTVTGLETYELPVIGTFIDPRIVPGFHYKVRRLAGRHLFGGKALKLDSIGLGYGKRLTFAPDLGTLNSPSNYFWSDTHPDGVGLEASAVRSGMKFSIQSGHRILGEAVVFRADAPQLEESQEIVIDEKEGCGKVVRKRIHIDVKCHVSLGISDVEGGNVSSLEPHDMRVSGTAILEKGKLKRDASIMRIENIGLDSQLNVLFFNQCNELVFYPI